MGCGGSKEEEVDEGDFAEVAVQNEVEAGEDALTTNKVSLEIAETDAVKAKPGSETFIASVLGYVIQLERPSAAVTKSWHWAIRRLAPGPGNWQANPTPHNRVISDRQWRRRVYH